MFPQGRLVIKVVVTLLLAASVGGSGNLDAGGIDRARLFRESPRHFIQKLDDQGLINWTAGYIMVGARVRLHRIVFDRRDPDFGKPGTVKSITDARAMAREEARAEATRKLVQSLGRLRVNSDFTLLQKLRVDSALRERFGELTSQFLVKSRRTGEGFVSVELAMPFFSSEGLYSMLAGPEYQREKVPEASMADVSDRITGLIVDMRGQQNFQPSLETRLYSDQGRRFYGPEVVSRRCATERGLAGYHLSLEDARRDPAVGRRPYYAVAAGVMGRGRSDIFLDADDVERVLGSPEARRALSRCGVAFVVNSGQKDAAE